MHPLETTTEPTGVSPRSRAVRAERIAWRMKSTSPTIGKHGSGFFSPRIIGLSLPDCFSFSPQKRGPTRQCFHDMSEQRVRQFAFSCIEDEPASAVNEPAFDKAIPKDEEAR